MGSDVIITGLPRSGLTIAAALADTLPNCVAINVPRAHLSQAKFYPSAQEYVKWLIGDFSWTRLQLLKKNPIVDFRASDGMPLLDGLYDPRQPPQTHGVPEPVWFTRDGLDARLTLSIKHHALYSAALPALAACEHFRIMAVIRHPYDVIPSWQRAQGTHAAEGRLPPSCERFWPEAAEPFQKEPDLLTRMVQVYDAYMRRYHELREQIHIVKFEDIVANPRLVSEWLFAEPMPTAARLIEKRQRIMDRDLTDQIRQRFRQYGVYTRQFYEL
jgi:hypothetical protein